MSKKILPLLAGALIALSSAVSNAQTTLTASLDTAILGVNPFLGVPGFTCSGHSSYYCYGVPFVFADGTVEKVWIDQNGINGTGFMDWLTDPLGLQGITYVGTGYFTGALITGEDSTGTFSFYGTTSSGQSYTGTYHLTFERYYSAGGGGRAGGAGYYYVIVAGNLTVTLNPLGAKANSPIAPTPVCIPGPPFPDGCPGPIPNPN